MKNVPIITTALTAVLTLLSFLFPSVTSPILAHVLIMIGIAAIVTVRLISPTAVIPSKFDPTNWIGVGSIGVIASVPVLTTVDLNVQNIGAAAFLLVFSLIEAIIQANKTKKLPKP